MNQRLTLTFGSITGGLGVVLGAFGSHSLKAVLTEAGRVDVYETAVRYQFYHAFALIATGILMNHFTSKKLSYAATCFFIGIIFFSGSLYLLCFTSVTMLGIVTPVGGLFFIAGWVLLTASVIKK